ncbi:recombinase family protein [Paracoccus sp. T5]|uniref:recombinase family protein n=1 Tax=Paracoccus sp. T5 TaxID=3402161 RepID=UPI003ADEC204
MTKHINNTTCLSAANAGKIRTEVLAYLRSASGAPVTKQLLCCGTWCTAAGLNLAEAFSDRVVSGTTDPLQRPGFASLMARVGRGGIAAVVVTDVARLGRNLGHVRSTVELLHQHGVELILAGGERVDPLISRELVGRSRVKRRRRYSA